MESKKVLLKIYPELNLGDDLFLKIVLERYKNTTFYILCDAKRYSSFSKQYNNIVLLDLLKHINIFDRALLKVTSLLSVYKLRELIYKRTLFKQYNICSNNYDVFLVVGGSMFIEGSVESSNRLIWYYEWVNKVFYDKSKFFIGCNFGPYKNEKFLKLFTDVFKKATQVSFRDSCSEKMFPSLKNIKVNQDIVFNFNFRNEVLERNSIGMILVDPRVKLNGVIDYEKYIDKVIEIVKDLIKSKKKVVFFSFCKKENDEILYRDILLKLSGEELDFVEVVCYNGNLEYFLKRYSQIEYSIVSRFHGVILSLLFGQKILPISYSNKIDNMLEEIGYNGEVFQLSKIDEFDAENVIEKLEFFPVSEDIKKSAEMHFIELDKILK